MARRRVRDAIPFLRTPGTRSIDWLLSCIRWPELADPDWCSSSESKRKSNQEATQEESMRLRSLGLVATLITSPAYADEAMTVVQDLGSKWQNAYNSGDAAKIADLYAPEVLFGSRAM